MNNFKKSLDRYLTSEPQDSGFLENVTDALTEDFFDKNEDWVMESDQFIEWCNNMEHKYERSFYTYHTNSTPLTIDEVARVIERAFNVYIKI